jgi:hypothetical protein
VSLSGPSVGKRQVEIREVRETKYQFLCSPLNGGLGLNLLIQSGTFLSYQIERKGLGSHVSLVGTRVFATTRQEYLLLTELQHTVMTITFEGYTAVMEVW